MKCWLFLCTIYVLAHYTDEHLVVLDPQAKNKDNEKLNPSSDEEAEQKSGDNASGKVSSEDEDVSVSDENQLNEISGVQEGSNESGQSDSEESEQRKEIMGILDANKGDDKDNANKLRNWMRWASETAAGNPSDIMGTNPHIYQPDAYPDLNRRFVLQYPYSERAGRQVDQNIEVEPDSKEIIPIEAPEELVMLVAKESAMRVASKPHDPADDIIEKKLLRTGEYWNGVWKEEVSPKVTLRSPNNDPSLGVIKAKILPGDEFYDVIAKMQKISPRLLYIINENNNNDK